MHVNLYVADGQLRGTFAVTSAPEIDVLISMLALIRPSLPEQAEPDRAPVRDEGREGDDA